jgi:uncharacterized membrane protein HdeD (DUF308 family)
VRTLGVVLIIAGVLALVYQGFTYTKREKVIDVGPIEASVDKKERVPLPPIIGAVALVGGIILVLSGRKSM